MAKKRKSSGKKGGRSDAPFGPSTEELLDMIAELPDLAAMSAAEDDPMFRQFLQQLGDEAFDEMIERDDSPMGQALDLLDDVQDASPKRRAAAARKALEICPDCSEAYGVLGDVAAGDEEALAHYRTAVDVSWRNLGDNPRRDFADHFWLAEKTRPFMLAKQNLARFLWDSGDVAAAIEQYRELLELNPHDNQGARYELANCLLREDRRDDLRKLLQQYYDDDTPDWAYSRALLTFRQQGDTPLARKMLRQAKKVNRNVIAYLVGKEELPMEPPDYVKVGGKDEAAAYALAHLRNWTETDGAVPWIRKVFKMNVVEPDERKRRPTIDRWRRIAADLPQNEGEVWQVDAASMADFDEEGMEVEPWMTAIVRDDDGVVVNVDLAPQRPTAEEVLTFVLRTMANDERREPARPAAVEVRRNSLYRAWDKTMSELGIELILCDELPACEDVLRDSSSASSAADRMTGALKDAAEGNLPPPDALPQATDEVWLADMRHIATWFDDEGTMVRPALAMVVDATNHDLLMQDVVMDETLDAERMWRVLLAAMHGPLEGEPRRPEMIAFRSEELIDQLCERLADIGIHCEKTDDLGPIDYLADELGRRMSGPEAPPALVDVPGITNEHLAAFFTAAAAFRQQAVWRGVPTDGLLRVERIQPEGAAWHGVVMGQSGMTYGLALYESLDDLMRLMSGQVQSQEEAIRISALSITFGEAFDIAPRDLAAQEQHGWPVVGKEGYPSITRVNQGGSLRPPLVWELELATACLAALPDFRYKVGASTTAKAPTGPGDVTVRLAWVDPVGY